MKFWNSSRHNLTAIRVDRLLLAGALATLLVVGLVSAAAAETPYVDPELKKRLQLAVADSSSFDDEFTATVWLTDMALRLNRRVPDPVERVEILQHVHHEARLAGLQPELVLAVIDIESAFDRFAISSAGARGLMQVMPFWKDELKDPNANLFEIKTNLRMGCTILRYYLDMENDELGPALARYNGSTGKTWYSQRVLNRLSDRWFQL
jgi:soluble lytic murein transglycosylase-like protein